MLIGVDFLVMFDAFSHIHSVILNRSSDYSSNICVLILLTNRKDFTHNLLLLEIETWLIGFSKSLAAWQLDSFPKRSCTFFYWIVNYDSKKHWHCQHKLSTTKLNFWKARWHIGMSYDSGSKSTWYGQRLKIYRFWNDAGSLRFKIYIKLCVYIHVTTLPIL